jgi:2-dehydropantoate 2-reductase
MEVAIVGVGGVGGFLGGKLATAFEDGREHRIYFMARGPHLEAIRSQGLILITQGTELRAKPWNVSENPTEWPRMDVVFLCVKGPDLERAARQIQPRLSPETVVIPIQNGVANREILEGILPHTRIAHGCFYGSAYIKEPGVVVHASGPGRLVFGRDPEDMDSLMPHRDLFLRAGIPAELIPHVEVEIWSKFLFLYPLAATMALFREPLGPVLTEEEKRNILVGLMQEVESLARARGVALPEEIIPRTLEFLQSFPPDSKSSLLRDLERSGTNEVDWLFRPMIQEGERLGLSLPLAKKVFRDIRSVWSLPSDD